MEFGWLIPVIIAIMIYACICYVIKSKNILPNVFAFMGPCLMIKTEHVGIFDTLARWKKLLIAYATTGVVLTVICGIVITFLFILTAYLTMLVQPEPVAPQNLLLIPGLNEYVPSTFAVWFALVFSMVIHEAGHGIMSRAENIRVKSTGILALVIPIGAFVEPEEEDVKNAPLATKLRMFAAGITNNLVVGTICLIILAAMLGMIVPGDHPYVYGVYSGYPAEEAGVMPGMIITAINDVATYSMSDVSAVLANTTAGQTVTLAGVYQGTPQMYDITLAAVPDELTNNLTTNTGFIGISFSEPKVLTNTLNTLTHPSSAGGALSSFLTFVVLPFSSMMGGGNVFGFMIADSPDPAILAAPFAGFWEIVHVLFWCAWINILLGIFNALPVGIFDGGQMLREWMASLFTKRGKSPEMAYRICSMITYVLVIAIIIPILMPYFF